MHGEPPDDGRILGDKRFFAQAGPFALDRLLAETGGEARRGSLLDGVKLTGVAPLDSAAPGQVSVLHNPRYGGAAERTRAGLVIVGAALAERVAPTSVALVVADPYAGWAKVAGLFHPAQPPVPGVHSSASVDRTADVNPSACVGACAVVGPHARIGADCDIGAGAVIGAGVVMGPGCRIGACASVSHAILGARVYVYPGARVGQEGFGFAITDAGFVTVPQLGRVLLHDDVEIGANACVDRGASHDTVVGRGTRLDNLVQIGHNARLGRLCLMAAHAGLSGSVTVEDFVQIGGQVGVAGHVTIGARSRIGAQAGVISDVAPGSELVGSPALPVREFFRNQAVLRRLARKAPMREQSPGKPSDGKMAD